MAHVLRGAGRAEERRAGRGARRVLGAQRRARHRRRRSRQPAAGRQPQCEGQRRRRAGRDRRQERGRHPRRRLGHIAGVPADPLLPHPRPSRSRPRSAGPGAPGAASRARSHDLRLRRDRLGASHPDLRHAGPGRSRHAAADHGPLAQDLLRQDRRGIHAHLRSRPEGVDPGAHRAYREPHRVHRRGPPHDPASASSRRRGWSAISA